VPVALALGEHLTQDVALGAAGEEKVDEAGAGDLRAGNGIVFRQRRTERLGELPGRHAQGLGHGQRQVACQIAVRRVPGALDLDLRNRGRLILPGDHAG
jgi:hypothetical protein